MICPVCESSNTVFAGDIFRFDQPFSIRKCQDCKSSYQYPAPKNSDLFYTDDYYSGKAVFSYIDERKIDKYARYVWNARIRNLQKFQKGGIFLDVGCSFGGLTRSASKYYLSYGIDISRYAVNQGNEFSKQTSQNKNFKGLFCGDLLNFPIAEIKNSSVAVVTMIEVAEHLENPVEHFKKAWELLMPGGVFLIQTANMTARQAARAGLNYHYYLPGHLTYFSEQGIEALLKKIGFTSVIKYFPVEFGLLPKLLKMRGNFTSWRDYFRWINVIYYHLSSFLRYKGEPLTSSMVVYAIK
ncbi:MAG: class I SAM-dependent methyltransferase [Spirochaetia bacterium]|nr:class I SAM-dependent methyltransferase [Spirochaetia bacterium]